MTKTLCDVCGKELSALEQMSAYNVAITSKNRTFRAPNRTFRTPWVRVYPGVCKDCAEKIANIIDTLKEDTND